MHPTLLLAFAGHALGLSTIRESTRPIKKTHAQCVAHSHHATRLCLLSKVKQAGSSPLDGTKSVHQQAPAPDVSPAHLHVAHLVHSVHCNAAWLCSFQCAKHAVLCSPSMLPFPDPSTIYAVTCLHACRCHLRRPPACPCACLQHLPRTLACGRDAACHTCLQTSTAVTPYLSMIPAVLCFTAVWHNMHPQRELSIPCEYEDEFKSWQTPAQRPKRSASSARFRKLTCPACAPRCEKSVGPTPTFAWSPTSGKKKQKACYRVDRVLVGDARQLAQVSARGNGPGKALGAATSTLRGHGQGARAVHVVCPTQCGRSGLHNADDDRAAQLHRPFPWPCFCMLMEPPSCRAAVYPIRHAGVTAGTPRAHRPKAIGQWCGGPGEHASKPRPGTL